MNIQEMKLVYEGTTKINEIFSESKNRYIRDLSKCTEYLGRIDGCVNLFAKGVRSFHGHILCDNHNTLYILEAYHSDYKGERMYTAYDDKGTRCLNENTLYDYLDSCKDKLDEFSIVDINIFVSIKPIYDKHVCEHLIENHKK